VTEASSTGNAATPILARQVRYLTGVARRAPSLHNTQPWRFTVSGDAIELRADVSRQLSVDPDGREMLISCGAALYGLRLAVRSLGYLPEVEILPGPAGRGPLARVRLGPAAPMTAGERKMLVAVPHRHTHRGPFEAGPLPAGLFVRLRDDARAEGAVLTDGRTAIRGRGPRYRDGATRSRARRGTACPRMPSPLGQPGRPPVCRSVTSISAAASAWRRPAAPRRWSPPRCSPRATANGTGCRPAKPCTGCC
jgi:hypothetical protein